MKFHEESLMESMKHSSYFERNAYNNPAWKSIPEIIPKKYLKESREEFLEQSLEDSMKNSGLFLNGISGRVPGEILVQIGRNYKMHG